MKLKAGCNFDPELLEGLAVLNECNPERRVVELYGSVPGLGPLGSARPDFRLRRGDERSLARFLVDARALGIELNYTVNASIADPRTLYAQIGEIERFLERLAELGVTRLTVAHPLIAKIVSEHSSLPIELSTILALRNARQLATYCDRFPRIDRVCLDVFGNRDFDRISDIRSEAEPRGVALEVLVNEFCVVDCIDRQACYEIHSLNLTDRERRLHNNYPMGNCIAQRMREPVQWLAARFVLPQWLDLYEAVGVDYIKISGRTHSTGYILRTVAAYMSDIYTGNLLDLWADVENIGRSDADYHGPRYHIDCSRLRPDFLDFYLESRGFGEEMAYLEGVLDETLVRQPARTDAT